jgi:hypothetical protein
LSASDVLELQCINIINIDEQYIKKIEEFEENLCTTAKFVSSLPSNDDEN